MIGKITGIIRNSLEFIIVLITFVTMIFNQFTAGRISISYVYNASLSPINLLRKLQELNVEAEIVRKFYSSPNSIFLAIENRSNEPRTIYNLKILGAINVVDLGVDSSNLSVKDNLSKYIEYSHDAEKETMSFSDIVGPPRSTVNYNVWGAFADYSYRKSVEADSNVPVRIYRYSRISGLPYFIAKNIMYILLVILSLLLIRSIYRIKKTPSVKKNDN
jgi:hypothetical protein